LKIWVGTTWLSAALAANQQQKSPALVAVFVDPLETDGSASPPRP
jgi:hypothetical protein